MPPAAKDVAPAGSPWGARANTQGAAQNAQAAAPVVNNKTVYVEKHYHAPPSYSTYYHNSFLDTYLTLSLIDSLHRPQQTVVYQSAPAAAPAPPPQPIYIVNGQQLPPGQLPPAGVAADVSYPKPPPPAEAPKKQAFERDNACAQIAKEAASRGANRDVKERIKGDDGEREVIRAWLRDDSSSTKFLVVYDVDTKTCALADEVNPQAECSSIPYATGQFGDEPPAVCHAIHMTEYGAALCITNLDQGALYRMYGASHPLNRNSEKIKDICKPIVDQAEKLAQAAK